MSLPPRSRVGGAAAGCPLHRGLPPQQQATTERTRLQRRRASRGTPNRAFVPPKSRFARSTGGAANRFPGPSRGELRIRVDDDLEQERLVAFTERVVQRRAELVV